MTLQQQAENILTKTDLVKKLSQFGEVHVVGNVAFETTIKPDIDIQVYCNLHYEDAATLIIQELTVVGMSDIRERRLKKSKKYLIMAKYETEGVVWDFDITLTQPSQNYLKDSYQFFLDFAPKLTPEKLALIMDFKQSFTDNKISGDNSSYYIYRGVLEDHVTTEADMSDYLEKMKATR
jgi:hypothetical protein